MKYLLIALIFTQSNKDHGPAITRELQTYDRLEECEREGELMSVFYQEGAVWMEPNAEPESVVGMRYLCRPVKE